MEAMKKSVVVMLLCVVVVEDNMLAPILSFFFLRKIHVASLSIMLGPSIISSILL